MKHITLVAAAIAVAGTPAFAQSSSDSYRKSLGGVDAQVYATLKPEGWGLYQVGKLLYVAGGYVFKDPGSSYWEKARNLCSISIDGITGWRLPTSVELEAWLRDPKDPGKSEVYHRYFTNQPDTLGVLKSREVSGVYQVEYEQDILNHLGPEGLLCVHEPYGPHVQKAQVKSAKNADPAILTATKEAKGNGASEQSKPPPKAKTYSFRITREFGHKRPFGGVTDEGERQSIAAEEKSFRETGWQQRYETLKPLSSQPIECERFTFVLGDPPQPRPRVACRQTFSYLVTSTTPPPGARTAPKGKGKTVAK